MSRRFVGLARWRHGIDRYGPKQLALARPVPLSNQQARGCQGNRAGFRDDLAISDQKLPFQRLILVCRRPADHAVGVIRQCEPA